MFSKNLEKPTIDLNDIKNMGYHELTDRLNIDSLSDVLSQDWTPFNVILPVNLSELILNRVKDNQSFFEINNDLSEYIYARYNNFIPSFGLTEAIDARGWK